LVDSTYNEEYGPVLVNGIYQNASALRAPGDSGEMMPFGGEAQYVLQLQLEIFLSGESTIERAYIDVATSKAANQYRIAIQNSESGSRENMTTEERHFEAIRNITSNMAAAISNRYEIPS
jgi:hypothetical protein